MKVWRGFPTPGVPCLYAGANLDFAAGDRFYLGPNMPKHRSLSAKTMQLSIVVDLLKHRVIRHHVLPRLRLEGCTVQRQSTSAQLVIRHANINSDFLRLTTTRNRGMGYQRKSI